LGVRIPPSALVTGVVEERGDGVRGSDPDRCVARSFRVWLLALEPGDDWERLAAAPAVLRARLLSRVFLIATDAFRISCSALGCWAFVTRCTLL
jgi:hypothetical protein